LQGRLISGLFEIDKLSKSRGVLPRLFVFINQSMTDKEDRRRMITGISPQKRNKERVNVYLDGEFAFGLSFTTAAGLSTGQKLAKNEIESLLAGDEAEKAKQSAYRFLSYRPRSVNEVRQNLRKKGYEEAVIDQVIDRLIELEMLDDLAFARYWVEQRETFKPRGRRALRYELSQKGISRETIDQIVDDVDERAAAQRAGRKKVPIWSGLPEDQFKQKMGQYLQRQGFDYAIVRSVVSELWESIEDDD